MIGMFTDPYEPTPPTRPSAFIMTHHGVRIDILAPKVDDIFLADIIYGLSRKHRWGGHFDGSWLTVAQHSVDVRDLYLREAGVCATLPLLRAALLHDAAEAYLPDMPSPLKATMPDFRDAEDRLIGVIAERFDVPLDCFDHPEIRRADKIALAWEQRDNRRCGDYRTFKHHELVPDEKHVAMHPEVANAAMWTAANRLGLIKPKTRKP